MSQNGEPNRIIQATAAAKQQAAQVQAARQAMMNQVVMATGSAIYAAMAARYLETLGPDEKPDPAVLRRHAAKAEASGWYIIEPYGLGTVNEQQS